MQRLYKGRRSTIRRCMQRLNTTHHTPCKDVALQRLFRANRGLHATSVPGNDAGGNDCSRSYYNFNTIHIGRCMQRLYKGRMVNNTPLHATAKPSPIYLVEMLHATSIPGDDCIRSYYNFRSIPIWTLHATSLQGSQGNNTPLHATADSIHHTSCRDVACKIYLRN
jgi:hypothetical protein